MFNKHVFLSIQHIEEVTGYIVIHQFSGNFIDFSSLRLIRGSDLYRSPPQGCKGTAQEAAALKAMESGIVTTENVRYYALFVITGISNFMGIKELWMPNLTGNAIN